MNREPIELIITAMLEEYKALRDEMKTIVDRQYSQMYWVISSVAILVAAVINTWSQIMNNPLISSGLFIFFIPGIITAYILSWSHIITKIARLGAHIYKIEDNLSYLLCDNLSAGAIAQAKIKNIKHPISWEHSLWKSNSHKLVFRSYRGVRISAALIYIVFTGIGAFLLKLYYWDKQLRLPYWLYWIIITVIGLLWFVIWMLAFNSIKNDLLSSLKQVKSNKTETLVD